MCAELDAAVIEAAGGIVVRGRREAPLVAVIYRERYGPEWALPKGKRQPGETWQRTALREVEEETGVVATIVGVAGATAYLAAGVPKLVLYWRMRADAAPSAPADAKEVKRIEWLTPADAVRSLSHTEEADLIKSHFWGPALIESWSSWLERQLVPIVQRRRWKRLGSDIAAFETELPAVGAAPAKVLKQVRAIENAKAALAAGDIDRGWKYLQAAHRLSLLDLQGDKLAAAAIAIKKEADKLKGWRKDAMLELLNHNEPKGQPSAERVFKAASLRDEHFGNEAYKDGLRRGNAARLAIVLLIGLASLFGLAYGELLPEGDLSNVPSLKWPSPLLSMALFGLLGATVSAITRMPDSQAAARIPEMVSTIRIMLLRLSMGPASAIVVYLALKSGIEINGTKLKGLVSSEASFVVSFVAGFSERLVMRVVDAIAKSNP